MAADSQDPNKVLPFQVAIDDFVGHLRLERGLSDNSLAAYRSDLSELARFLGASTNPSHVSMSDVNRFFTHLAGLGRKPATMARKVSSVRHFYDYLVVRGMVPDNPAKTYRAPKISRYHPDYLSVAEIERIIEAAKRADKQPARDTAIVEVLYGCGLRISELINLKLT
ncbi:tyrosine-type recombinase/integrase, partial [candidate division GN15 bacterium]|nr:tyrosine-type recombinase/integrase [candidate division GN15 bacterium]